MPEVVAELDFYVGHTELLEAFPALNAQKLVVVIGVSGVDAHLDALSDELPKDRQQFISSPTGKIWALDNHF